MYKYHKRTKFELFIVELDYKYIFCVGVAGKFPPNYIGGMMSGQALGGIFPSLVNILVIAIQVNIAF